MAIENKIGCLLLTLCFVSFGFAATCQSTTNLGGSSGTIRGPGYPGNYPNNAVYCWRIYVPLNYVVRLNISTLNMEVCTGCNCDSIEVFNGYSESSSRIGKICSKSLLANSSGQYLFVKFTSDATGTGTAFTASYYRLAKGIGSNNNGSDNGTTSGKSTCQSTTNLRSSSGTIRGPGYPGNYPNNAVYCWRIYVPTNYAVKLNINTLNMEVCTGCNCDSIEVFDGYSELSSRIGKICSKSLFAKSSGQYLFVKFTSDATGTGTAFTASYYRLAKGIGSNNGGSDNSTISGLSFGVKVGVGAGIGGLLNFIFWCWVCYACCRSK